MITTPAFLLVPGDRIQHRSVDFEIARTSVMVDEVRPRVQLVVLRGGNGYRLTFDQTEYVARHEGNTP